MKYIKKFFEGKYSDVTVEKMKRIFEVAKKYNNKMSEYPWTTPDHDEKGVYLLLKLLPYANTLKTLMAKFKTLDSIIDELKQEFPYIVLDIFEEKSIKLYISFEKVPGVNYINYSFAKKVLLLDDTLLHNIDEGKLVSYKFIFGKGLSLYDLEFAPDVIGIKKLECINNIVSNLRKKFKVQIEGGGHEVNMKMYVDFDTTKESLYRYAYIQKGYIDYDLVDKFNSMSSNIFQGLKVVPSKRNPSRRYFGKSNDALILSYDLESKAVAVQDDILSRFYDFMLGKLDILDILKDMFIKSYNLDVTYIYAYEHKLVNE